MSDPAALPHRQTGNYVQLCERASESECACARNPKRANAKQLRRRSQTPYHCINDTPGVVVLGNRMEAPDVVELQAAGAAALDLNQNNFEEG